MKPYPQYAKETATLPPATKTIRSSPTRFPLIFSNILGKVPYSCQSSPPNIPLCLLLAPVFICNVRGKLKQPLPSILVFKGVRAGERLHL